MSPLWLLPGLIALVGGAVVVALARSAAEEARLLGAELGRQSAVADKARRVATEVREMAREHRPRGQIRGRR